MLALLLLCLTALAGHLDTLHEAELPVTRLEERLTLYQQAVEEADAALRSAGAGPERADALEVMVRVRLHVGRGGTPWQVRFDYHPLPDIWEQARLAWQLHLPELARHGLADQVAVALMDHAATYGAGSFEVAVAHDCLARCTASGRDRAGFALERKGAQLARAEAAALAGQQAYRRQWEAPNREVDAIQAQQAENDLFDALRDFSGPEQERIIAPIRHSFAVDRARSEMRRRGSDSWWGAHEDLTMDADPRWWWLSPANERERHRLARHIRYKPMILLGLGARADSQRLHPLLMARVSSGAFWLEAEAGLDQQRLRGAVAVAGKPMWTWRRWQLAPTGALVLQGGQPGAAFSLDYSYTYRSKGFAVLWNATIAPELSLVQGGVDWGLRLSLASGTPWRPRR